MKKIFLPMAVFATFLLLIGFIYKNSLAENPESQQKSNSDRVGDVEGNLDDSTPISIRYLRSLNYESDSPIIEEELTKGSNYKRYIASYKSDGNKIYGLLTIPDQDQPENGFKAIVFNHGYIPPQQYITTEKYVSYVDYLARNGFVVFKIDMRGHGKSEGISGGSYFSAGYTIDAINAVKSLQKLEEVNPNRIGMWGHSMAGNLTLRAMEVSSDIKAGVIWAGAVYSYEDFAKYRLNDGSYVQRNFHFQDGQEDPNRLDQNLVSKLRDSNQEIDFNESPWVDISLTKNINYLNSPVQLHHSINDQVVNIGYSRDLEKVLKENGKVYEFYEYQGGGHNIESPYFETAMQRTVKFFDDNL